MPFSVQMSWFWHWNDSIMNVSLIINIPLYNFRKHLYLLCARKCSTGVWHLQHLVEKDVTIWPWFWFSLRNQSIPMLSVPSSQLRLHQGPRVHPLTEGEQFLMLMVHLTLSEPDYPLLLLLIPFTTFQLDLVTSLFRISTKCSKRGSKCISHVHYSQKEFISYDTQSLISVALWSCPFMPIDCTTSMHQFIISCYLSGFFSLSWQWN